MEIPYEKYEEILKKFSDNISTMCDYLNINKDRLVIVNPKYKKLNIKNYVDKSEKSLKKQVKFKDLIKKIREQSKDSNSITIHGN